MFPDLHVSVEPSPNGPLVVKTAKTTEAEARLASEVTRLERARHPGVVEIRDISATRLELAWAGSETLATLRTSVTQSAGILASLSATVADLHDLGIVHGTLEPSHVVVGADGRPRLCSLGGPHHDPDGGLPAEDVAAIGRLIGHMVEPGVDLEPIPEKRWSRRRWSGYQRRSLQTLADQATHEDPARRPTARSLAASLAEAIPEASIQPLDGQLATPVERPEPQAEEDSTTAEGAGISQDGPGPTSPETELVGEALTDAEVDEPPSEPPVVPASHDALVARMGLRIEPTAEAAGFGPMVDRNDNHTPNRSVLAPADAPERPRPVALPPTRSARKPASPLLVAAVVAACLLVAAGALGAVHRSRGSAAEGRLIATAPTGPVPTDSGQGASADSPDPTAVGASGCARIDGPAPCREALIDGRTVTVGSTVFAVGEDGDQVSIGDWDCDGSATPGLVRPETGEVFLFTTWAADDQPVTIEPTAVVPGAQRLEPPASDQCQPPSLEMADETTRRLDETAAPR